MKKSDLNRVKKKLADFVGQFALHFHHRHECRSHWCRMYMSGLLLDGDRKSAGAMATRLQGADEQSLQQFISQSPWVWEDVMGDLRRSVLSSIGKKKLTVVLDDTSLPKKGEASVGVARQYCGALGKISNCQVFVSLQGVVGKVHVPLNARLYLPRDWTDDPKRMDKAKIPPECRGFQEKWRLALELIDEASSENKISSIVFDAGYGGNRVFLKELDDRNLQFVGQIPESETFWDGEIEVSHESQHKSGQGRPRKHARPADGRRTPKSAKEWRDLLFAESNIKPLVLPSGIKVEYAAMRVYEAVARPFHCVGAERWLIIERLSDGSHKYYVSNFSESVKASDILKTGHERWKIEQGYQQLKEELGLDHFEGRSWDGLHRHITLCFMAFDFLQLLRLESGGKKSADSSTDQVLAEPTDSHLGLSPMRKAKSLGARSQLKLINLTE